MWSTIEETGKNILSVLFPRTCAGCGNALKDEQEMICPECMEELAWEENPFSAESRANMRMKYCFGCEQAVSFIKYCSDGRSGHIARHFKYNGRQNLARWMGEMMGRRMELDGLFLEGMEYVMPLPLHKKREQWRGYNQSRCIAEGIAQTTGLTLTDGGTRRVVNNKTQTKRNFAERDENVKGIFKVFDNEVLKGKGVVIVDDVMTTGATMRELVASLRQVEGIRIKVATLFIT